MTALPIRPLAPPLDDTELVDVPGAGDDCVDVAVALLDGLMLITVPDVWLLDALGLDVTVLNAALFVEVAFDVELVEVELLRAAQLVKFWPPRNLPTVDTSVKWSWWSTTAACVAFVAQKLMVSLKRVAALLQTGPAKFAS